MTPDGNSSAKAEVEHVLHTQQEVWNRHDLEGFMAGYWNSPESRYIFFGRSTESMKAGRRTNAPSSCQCYTSPGHEMGKLEFSGLRIEMLWRCMRLSYAGSWHLTMSDGKTPHGLFTLVFRKFPEGWKIVHDHTSVGGNEFFDLFFLLS